MCPSGQASIGHKPGASEGGSVGEGPRGAFRAPSGREPFFRTPGLATWKPTPVLKQSYCFRSGSVGELLWVALPAPSVRKPFFPDHLPYDLGAGTGFEEACLFGCRSVRKVLRAALKQRGGCEINLCYFYSVLAAGLCLFFFAGSVGLKIFSHLCGFWGGNRRARQRERERERGGVFRV